jgi:hypothetical protein
LIVVFAINALSAMRFLRWTVIGYQHFDPSEYAQPDHSLNSAGGAVITLLPRNH